MGYLIASFVLTCALHGWLILSRWGSNPSTLSYHAVKTRFSLLVYAIVHLITGALLWLFVNELFVGHAHSWLIVIIAAIAVIAEWLQALVPARGVYEKWHMVFAVTMAASMWLLVLTCTLLLARSHILLWFNILTSLLIGSFFLAIRQPPRPGFWRLQYLGQLILYLQTFLLALPE